jgi:asparagine synthetase B (glutamine-hydrolysing)
MPGIFGAVGFDQVLRENLQRQFSAPWGGCETVRLHNGIMGGHAFHPKALHALEDGTNFVVDGERSIYKVEVPPFRFSPGLELGKNCKGNVAIATNDMWHLATDWSGSFPLYYACTPQGLLFCSRLRPLAQILRPEIDTVALRQFLHACYMMSGRTFYKGISRLLPGQILTYEPSCNRISSAEASKAWVGIERSSPSEAWEGLVKAVSTCFDKSCSNAVMMSGGWDSRTLLAAVRSYLGSENLLAYYHGGKESLEGKIARDISQSLGVKFHYEPLSEALFDLDALKIGFSRTETVYFPAWHHAARVLSSSGVNCVSSGIFGEMLGGHYGRTMFHRGARKIFTFLIQGLGRDSSMASVFDALQIQQLGRPSLVRSEVLGNVEQLRKAMNDDIQYSLMRFIDRGVQSSDQLVEAFITEHRASQHISSQMLSCRSHLDVSIPFCDQEFFTLVSRIPITAKLHNALNRRMLHQYCPEVLRFPTAAAPVSAAMPIWVQELSRLIRSIVEKRVQLPALTWYDWTFLKNGVVFNRLVDDLELDLWDKNVIRQKIADLQGSKSVLIGHLMQLLLIAYTVDLMLRSDPAIEP